MTIGIYTIHACNNFGALLQAYATTYFISKNGYDCEIVNLMSNEEEAMMSYRYPWNHLKHILYNLYASIYPAVHRKISNISQFRALIPLSIRYRSIDELISNSPTYDIHLVGSDQVWNVERGECDPLFFLSFLKQGETKMSFASSFGNLAAAQQMKDQIIQQLRSFKFLSVREQDAAVFLQNECGLAAECVLDPTFLLDSEWHKLAGDTPLIRGKYILYYGFDTDDTCREAIEVLRKKLGIPVVGVSVSLHSPYKFDKFVQEAGPIEFLNLVKYANLVLTSSFHGVALSVNFRRDFVVLRHGTRMSRMESLLSQFGLCDRIVDGMSGLYQLLERHIHISYQEHTFQIQSEVEHTRKTLLDNLSRLCTKQ